MSTVTSTTGNNPVAGIVRVARSVRISLPASGSIRDAVAADARRIYGLDLDDDDRAAKVRDRRS